MGWYYVAEGRQAGPVTEEQFRSLVASGPIRPETLVWREGMAAWSPYATVSGAAGGVVPQAGLAGAVRPGGLSYGGFWIRFLARVVDALILAMVNGVLTLPFAVGAAGRGGARMILVQGIAFGMSFAVALAYETLFLGRFGATPGKMICRLRVVRPDGAAIRYPRALGRYLATILSQIILFIGYLMAAFDPEKRSLHDRICDTRVVKG